jgi:predicted TIM-barrel fold metal-dependent hydrolase
MTKYRATFDLDGIVAIDVHTHVTTSVDGSTENPKAAEMAEHFGSTDVGSGTLPELADYYRSRNMVAVAFTVDTGPDDPDRTEPSNEEVVRLATQHSDAVLPFASIHPARGQAGVEAAERLITEYGVRGFKFHPSIQGFFPNDRSAYPLFEVLAAHRIPALFHSGQSGTGAGTPGGGGIRLKYSNPMAIDDVAVDFPDMPIVIAHPSFPWQEEALSVATHKAQVYIDLSGWSPKYFPPILVQYANTLLRDKMLFGSDFPLITPERWLADLEKTGIRDEVKPGILKDNAVRFFGLDSIATT